MQKGFNIELILVLITLVAGLIVLGYYLYRKGKPKLTRSEEPAIVDFAKSFFPILLIVLVVRSFVAEPFRIPSGSMIPTLEIGDFILVKKYSYGVRLPVTRTKILDIGTPERGDVVVFRYPVNPEINYIKRLVGLPGDTIEWSANKELTINGKKVSYHDEKDYAVKNERGNELHVAHKTETFSNQNQHRIINFPGLTQSGRWKVPEGHYFMMGDNRDNSSDSRYWGYVSEEHLVGKASFVWMHWNWLENGDGFQIDRIGSPVN